MKTKTTKHFLISVMLLLLVSIIISCCCSPDKLLDNTWVLEQYGSENSQVNILDPSGIVYPAKSEIILQFKDDNKFNGNDGCNSIFGEYEVNRRCKIKFGSISTTLMMCQENVMNQASSIRDLLKRSVKYKVTATHLKLYTPDGEILIYIKNNP